MLICFVKMSEVTLVFHQVMHGPLTVWTFNKSIPIFEAPASTSDLVFEPRRPRTKRWVGSGTTMSASKISHSLELQRREVRDCRLSCGSRWRAGAWVKEDDNGMLQALKFILRNLLDRISGSREWEYFLVDRWTSFKLKLSSIITERDGVHARGRKSSSNLFCTIMLLVILFS